MSDHVSELNVAEPTGDGERVEAPGHVFGLDIGGLAGEYVDAAVKNAVRKQIAEVASEAVSQALTPVLIETLRSRATTAAAAAVTEQVEANKAEPRIEETKQPESQAEPVPELLYPSLDAWVENFYSVIYARPASSARTWCPKWWLHDEAVYRLQALWTSWEFTRINDGAVAAATWLVNWADPITAQLTSVDGCFKGCTIDDGHRQRDQLVDNRLPCDQAPPQLSQPRT